MQIFTATGRLTRDPEEKFTATGKNVTHFSIAVDRAYGKEVDFFNCQAWGKTGELVAQYLSKGSQCQVIGEVHLSKVDDKVYTNVNVNRVKFLDGGRKEEPGRYHRQEPTEDRSDFPVVDDDEIPF